MITGRQIREARELLHWDIETLSLRSHVHGEILNRAESVDRTPSVTLGQAALIQQALESAGIRFGRTGGVVHIRAVKEEP